MCGAERTNQDGISGSEGQNIGANCQICCEVAAESDRKRNCNNVRVILCVIKIKIVETIEMFFSEFF